MAKTKKNMDLTPLGKSKKHFTLKLGDVTRQLSFSGIAVVWIFTISENKEIKLALLMLCALVFFVLSLFFDLLHYFYGATRDCFLYSKYEKENNIHLKKTTPFTFNPWWNYPKTFLKFSASIFTIIGYFLLLMHIYSIIKILK